MSIKAIDPLGVTVEYPTATRWFHDAALKVIHLYSHAELTATVPGHWIVCVVPFSQVDPGVEARD